MMSCGRTAEVQELLRLGHWPQAAGEELAAHVRQCRKCSEYVLVTQAMQSAKASAMREARPEPPALVWWRAQLRRRREVVRRVDRPMRTQMLVILALVCVGLALSFRLDGGVAAWSSWISAGAHAAARSGLGSFGIGYVVASAAVLAMMAGVVVYLTVERK